MKIAVTAIGATLEDELSPRFGRCPYFLIVDTETMAFEAVQNPYASASGGAGVQSAQLVISKNVSAVLTDNPGPKASSVLKTAQIEIVSGISGTVRSAVEQFKAVH